MKKVAATLAALLAGCGATGALTSTEMPDAIEPPWAQERNAAEIIMQANLHTGAAYDASTLMSMTICNNSEPIITMDEHGYTIECGGYSFVHYQHPVVLDADGKLVLEAACEDTLFLRTALPMFNLPELKTIFKWMDSDCDGNMDYYGAWQQFGSGPAYSIDEFQSATMDSFLSTDEQRAQAYRNLVEKLNLRQIQQAWEALYLML